MQNTKQSFFVEITDTFGGEANYSWVKRFIVRASTFRGAISKVSKETPLVDCHMLIFKHAYMINWLIKILIIFKYTYISNCLITDFRFLSIHHFYFQEPSGVFRSITNKGFQKKAARLFEFIR